MRILLVGSGGREHALAWAISASPLCRDLWCAPGNAGIAAHGTCVPIAAGDVAGIVTFAREKAIDFVIIGPEAPLVAGLADRLRAAGIRCFGPGKDAARLESSKGFSRDLCAKYAIPGPAYRRISDVGTARDLVRAWGTPIVVKADGLAAGKGVCVARDVAEADAAIDAALTHGAFGAAGRELVLEEYLEGEELSWFALCDGENALALASAQDHKTAFDGDRGPNTGGMGVCSPAPQCTTAMEQRIITEILNPTLAAMKAEGHPYQGVLFIGVMVCDSGPKLIEFNVRFGDPECQALVMRLKSDLLPVLVACADGMIGDVDLRWRDDVAISVVMVSRGYPGPYTTPTPIRGLEAAAAGDDDVMIFHAGTSRGPNGEWQASGGRVLNVTARGRSVREARDRAYRVVAAIDWPDGFWRRDIGARALAREGDSP